MFGLSELAVILVVVILVLGAKRLPDLARSAGKSARILKAEARAAKEEEQARAAQETPPTASRVIEGQIVTPAPGPRQDSPAANREGAVPRPDTSA